MMTWHDILIFYEKSILTKFTWTWNKREEGCGLVFNKSRLDSKKIRRQDDKLTIDFIYLNEFQGTQICMHTLSTYFMAAS